MSDDHLLPLNDPDDWRSIAACKGVDTAIFFDHLRSHEALAYCAECPVIDECKQAGRGEAGVWGGVAAPAELHACAWCSKLFQRGPAQRPGQRLMCSAACRFTTCPISCARIWSSCGVVCAVSGATNITSIGLPPMR